METQEISAPTDGLTGETPKRRQVGYGLPCAKCHKYFPADLEVCPICNGRERVSPVVAPRIPKPVKSETSAAPSSSNIALKYEVKVSPKSESPAVAPPVEIRRKDHSLDQKEPITPPLVAELTAARSSLLSTQEQKESLKPDSPAFAPPVEIKVKDHSLDQKEPITIPVVAEIQATVELARASLVSTQPVLTQEEKESPKSESPAFAPPEEIKVNDQLTDQKESITISAIAEIPATVEPALASHLSTQKAKESPKPESPASTCLNDQNNNDQPNYDQPNQEEPIAIPVLVETQPCDLVPTTIVTTSKEEELTTALETAGAAIPIHTAVEDQRQDDQRRDQINEALRIVIPMLIEAQASDPVPTAVEAKHEAVELPNKVESPAVDLPKLLDFPQPIAVEEQHPDPTSHEQPVVIPTLMETQVSDSAPVAAEREMEQEKKAEAPEMLGTPRSASEVKVVDVEIAEVKIVESPADFDRANGRRGEKKSKAIDNGFDAPPNSADVTTPVVVHVNLGELRAPKSTPELTPTPAQFKEIQPGGAAARRADTSSDIDPPEPPIPDAGRKFDLVTFALGVVVLACAVLLISLAALRLMPRHTSEPVRKAKATYSSASPTADQNTNAPIPTPPPRAAIPGNLVSSDSSPVVASTAVPAQPPGAASASNLLSSADAKQVLTLSPDLPEGNLLYRVEPDYPEEARRQGVQGLVVLDLHISKDGLVQGVDVVSGQPLLAQAATAAVKQWRFRTRYVNGDEIEMQARITLRFNLPTQ